MKKLCGILLLVSFGSVAFENETCKHLAVGVPKQSDQINCLEGYAIGYNYNLKAADWVGYVLKKQIGQGVDRQDDFRSDLSIPQQFRTTPEDYEEPVYDMGHLANSESIDGSVKANSETFLMSNMTPQLGGHNRAIWKGLENRERKWANRYGEVIVFTGALYSDNPDTIGVNKVPVPNKYWKVIFNPKTKKAISFIIPHRKLKTSQLNKYLSSVDEVETASGIDLFNSFPVTVQASFESVTPKKQW